MFAGLHVEHESGQRPMQLRQRAAHEAKAAARELDAHFKIQPQPSADVHMVARREVELARLAPLAHQHIARLALAHRRRGVRQIGQGQQQVLQTRLDHFQPLGAGVQLVFDGGDFLHQAIHIGAFGLLLADLFGDLVALRLQGFGAGLQGLALGLQRFKQGNVQKRLR